MGDQTALHAGCHCYLLIFNYIVIDINHCLMKIVKKSVLKCNLPMVINVTLIELFKTLTKSVFHPALFPQSSLIFTENFCLGL